MNIKDYAPVVSLKAKVDVDELFIVLLVLARIHMMYSDQRLVGGPDAKQSLSV